MNVSVKLGSIRHSSGPEYESCLEVAWADCEIYDEGWSMQDPIIDSYWRPYVPLHNAALSDYDEHHDRQIKSRPGEDLDYGERLDLVRFFTSP